MPLLARTGLAAPSLPPPPGAPRPLPLRLSYTDPDGVTWPWYDVRSGAFVTGASGLGSSPSALSVLSLPGGEVLPQDVTPAIQPVVIGLYAYDDDQGALWARLDALATALSHDRAGQFAAGTLVAQRPDGSARQRSVWCSSGSDQPDDDGLGFIRSATYGLTFQPLSPFWEDAADIEVTFGLTPSGGGVPPMPPVLLSPSTVLGETSVTNSGDADAWPVWTITGPGTPTLKNVTTGLQFSFSTALEDSEQRIVDTRPGLASAVDGDGADWWADLVLSSPRDLWQLARGVNQLDLQLSGADTGSQILMSYRRKWRRS